MVREKSLESRVQRRKKKKSRKKRKREGEVSGTNKEGFTDKTFFFFFSIFCTRTVHYALLYIFAFKGGLLTLLFLNNKIGEKVELNLLDLLRSSLIVQELCF